MARQLAWALAALLLVPAASSAAGTCDHQQPPDQRQAAAPADKGTGDRKPDQPHQRPKWWVEPKLRQEFGITDQQSAAIDAIWKKDYAMRVERNERLEKLEAVLSQMILSVPDEAVINAQIDKVEAARSEANKSRVLMLYRINKVLKPEQRAKVDAKAKAMREQRDRGRGSSR
jgi:Spy/CpxP family protein refolding chaperone